MASYWNSNISNNNNNPNNSSLTEKKGHPWQATLRKLEEEEYHQEIAPRPSSSSMPRYPPPQQQQQQQQPARGESVRVNYASSRSGGNRRRPRVGIFRSTSPTQSAAAESNMDSLELALQDTSRTTNSTVSSAESHRSPQSQSSPKRPYSPTSESVEAELAYIQRLEEPLRRQNRNNKRRIENEYYGTTHRSNRNGKPPRQQHQQQQQYPRHQRGGWTGAPSPNPTNPFAPSPTSPVPYHNHHNNNHDQSTNPFARDSPATTQNNANASDAHGATTNPFEDEYSNRGSAAQSPITAMSAGDPFSHLSSPQSTYTSSSGDNPFRGVVEPPATHSAAHSAADAAASATSSNNRRRGGGDAPSTDGTSTNCSDDPRFLERLGLHLLCAEATSQHDIAWRNALYLLGMQPLLAKELDHQGRTALHIACTGPVVQDEHQPQQQQHHPTAPPCFMIRALMIANPGAIQHTDQDGRLPLHCLAAASGDVDSLQLLVEAHPESIAVRDAMGWTPLHLFLLNPQVHVTVAQTQILLGMTLPLPPQQEQQQRARTNNIKQRRGDHLRLKVNDLDQVRRTQNSPYSLLWQPIQRYMIPEDILNSYPEDVHVCLRRLAKWERKEHRRQKKEEGEHEPGHEEPEGQQNQTPLKDRKESPFASMGIDASGEAEINPAAMQSLHDGRLPLHMIIHRGLLDIHLQRSRVEEAQVPKRKGHRQDQSHGQHTLIVIVRLLISAHPEGLIAREINGHTPLLLAMVTASDVLPSQELLEMLLGKRTAGYESLPSWAQDTPYPVHHLHMPNSQKGLAPAAERYSNPAMVATLDTCRLPLHLAAEDWGDHASLLVAIYESYPGAIHVQDARGRMPLHVLLENYRQITPHPQIVALLLSERVARTFTDEGQLPFDLLVACGPYLPSDAIPCNEPVSPNGTVVHPDPYKAFQMFFHASILASSTAARADNNILRRRAQANVFLFRLRSLPPWLRRQACSAPFVQELLLEELASPSKCAFVMVYGLLLTFLLVTFRRQMELFIDTGALIATPLSQDANATLSLSFFEGREEILDAVFDEPSIRYESWNTLAIYGLSAGSIGFQAVFWALSYSLSEFQHLCLFSLWRWIDLTAVLTTVTTSVLIHESFPDEQVLFVGTAATGLLWCSLVGFLTNWWYEMAFFTGSLLKIARMIVWPIVAAGILIVGFAEMFYTLSQVDCEQSLGSMCSLRDAYHIVYYLIAGEPIVELGSLETLSAGMAVLVAMFFLLMFLLFLCTLAVVIVVASKCDAENVALDAYWEPKLAFVLSSQDARVAASRQKTGLSVPQPTRVDRLVARLGELWEVQTGLLFGGKEDRHWYARSSSAWQNCCMWVFSAFFIPLWLFAGVVTMGFLWPPQVRQFLFRPRSSFQGDIRPNEAREFFTSQVAGVRNEVIKMKDMSYAQSNEIHRDIQELRGLLVGSLKD